MAEHKLGNFLFSSLESVLCSESNCSSAESRSWALSRRSPYTLLVMYTDVQVTQKLTVLREMCAHNLPRIQVGFCAAMAGVLHERRLVQ